MQKQLLVVRGLRIALVSCAARDESSLLLQFQRLGIQGESFADYSPAIFDVPYDSVIFDSDNRALIKQLERHPWPSLPKIALMGMETPSRVAWVIEQEVNGCLRKPVKSAGILSTIILARHHFSRQKELTEKINQHERRIQLRRFLLSAQLLLIKELDCSEKYAYELLRRLATEQRKTIEEFCVTLLSHPEAWTRHIKSLSL
ncbi:ANTAR domain-containing response regulator [Martelella alba]|uniref:Antitermination regulator n=1 Tax=Martelella alba TaxID=2590451 RepID=A0ABY2SE03_9HYPH|nr:ANTAR domain-containing protein [Martelella alba]TKI02921.1 antitermination regulator [Martelella alba]